MTLPRPHAIDLEGFDTLALVLQGGGALGAYQAGVCQGLHQAGIQPGWVAGISIGALNCALLAGNAPEHRLARLQTFWDTICQPPHPPVPGLGWDWVEDQMLQWLPDARRYLSSMGAWQALLKGQSGFFIPRGPAPWLGNDIGPQHASFYDTCALKATLTDLVDFERLNHGDMRVSVGAVNVRTGQLTYFDNQSGPTKGQLRAEHFMASGALPPAFPAVEIDGEHYWDGGLVSNTPLAYVRHHHPPDQRTLAFQIDLWNAHGPVPRNVYEAQERMKDIQYASRLPAHQAETAPPSSLLSKLTRLLRGGFASSTPALEVIKLVYQRQDWESQSKDYEFTPRTMTEHWQSGLADIKSALQSGRTTPAEALAPFAPHLPRPAP